MLGNHRNHRSGILLFVKIFSAFLLAGMVATCFNQSPFLTPSTVHAASNCFPSSAIAQDGSISASEYANNNSGNWYIAWDDTYLYIAKTGGTSSEPVYIYLDTDPIAPVNGGSFTNGNIIGTTEYGTTPNLPFRADARIYMVASTGYSEIKVKNGGSSGGWNSTPDTNPADVTMSPAGGTNREVKIRWAALSGLTGRPASFNWFGYEASTATPYNVSDQTPSLNYSGSTTSSPNLNYYYTVSDTTSTSCTAPFSQTSYTFPGGNIANFPQINVYDFTLNSVGSSISRSSASGQDWNIAGTLRIENGSIDFFNTTSATNIGKDLVIGSGGSLKSTSGNVNVGGNFTNSNGTSGFNANSGLFTFNGAGSEIINASNTFFYNVTISNTGSGSVTANTALSIQTLNITAGTFNIANSSTINNNLTVAANSNFNSSSGAITFGGNPSIITNNGTTSFNDLIINSGRNLNLSGSILVAGNFTNNGTFSPATNSTVSFTGTTPQTIIIGANASSTIFPFVNVVFSNTTGVTVPSSVNVSGNFSNTVGFTANGSTVTFNGASVQNIYGNTTFSKVIINSGSSTILNNDITLTNFTNNSTGFNFNGNMIKVASGGNITNSGATLNGANVTFNGSGTTSGTKSINYSNLVTNGSLSLGTASTITGTLKINLGGSINNTAPSYSAGSILSYGNGLNTYSRGLEWSSTSGAGYPQNVTIGTGTTLDLGAGGVNIARAIAGDLTLLDSTSTLTTNGSGNQMTASLTIGGSVSGPGNLILSALTGGNLFVGGNWSPTNFTANGRTVTFNGMTAQTLNNNLNFSSVAFNNSAGISQVANTTLFVSNNFTNTNGFNVSAGTVNFNGSGIQNLVINSAATFNNLIVSSGVTLTETIPGDVVNLNGVLTNNGVIEETQPLISNSNFTFGLTGVSINITSTGTLSSITIDRIDSNNSTAPGTIQTGRYWNLTTNTNGIGYGIVTLPLGSVPQTSAKVCRQSSPGDTNWVCQVDNTTSTTVSANDITIADPPTPIAYAVGQDAPNGLRNLNVNTSQLNFEAKDGVSNSQGIQLSIDTVTTNWIARIEYETNAGEWLSLSQNNGILFPGVPSTIKITPASKHLNSGIYKASIYFEDKDKSAKPAVVKVELDNIEGYIYYLPSIANNAMGFNSHIILQNVGKGQASIQTQYFDSEGGNVTSKDTQCNLLAIEAKCNLTSNLTTQTIGTGTIKSNQPLEVLVTQDTPYGLSAYTGGAEAANELVAPVAINNANGFSTELTLNNVQSSDTIATVNFYDQSGALLPDASKHLFVKAFGTQKLDQTDMDSGLPPGFYGWAKIESSTGNLLVVQILEHNLKLGFVAFADARPYIEGNIGSAQNNKVYAPAIFNGAFGGFVTGANIVNPNNNPVEVSVTYYDNTGKPVPTTSFVIAPHAVIPIYHGATSGVGLPSGGLAVNFYGSAEVSSTGGNIIMLVNEAALRENNPKAGTNTTRSGTYEASSQGSNMIGLPVIQNNSNGFTTGTTILNISDNFVNGIITYYNEDGTNASKAQEFQIAPHASLPLFQGGEQLPVGFNGQAVITQIPNVGSQSSSFIVTTNVQANSIFYSY